jgi:hypothetical protein
VDISGDYNYSNYRLFSADVSLSSRWLNSSGLRDLRSNFIAGDLRLYNPDIPCDFIALLYHIKKIELG